MEEAKKISQLTPGSRLKVTDLFEKQDISLAPGTQSESASGQQIIDLVASKGSQLFGFTKSNVDLTALDTHTLFTCQSTEFTAFIPKSLLIIAESIIDFGSIAPIVSIGTNDSAYDNISVDELPMTQSLEGLPIWFGLIPGLSLESSGTVVKLKVTTASDADTYLCKIVLEGNLV